MTECQHPGYTIVGNHLTQHRSLSGPAIGLAAHTPAAALLAHLRHDDPRLLLSVRDIERLTPPVAAWLECGASPEAVRAALTTGLPATLRRPAALLARARPAPLTGPGRARGERRLRPTRPGVRAARRSSRHPTHHPLVTPGFATAPCPPIIGH